MNGADFRGASRHPQLGRESTQTSLAHSGSGATLSTSQAQARRPGRLILKSAVLGVRLPGPANIFLFDLWNVARAATASNLRPHPYQSQLRFGALLWLVAQMISDSVNRSGTLETMQGAGYIICLWVAIESLCLPLDRTQRVSTESLVLLSAATSLAMALLYSPLFSDLPWKFGIGYFVTVVLLSAYRRLGTRLFPLLLLLIAVSFLTGSRSLAAAQVAVGVVWLWSSPAAGTTRRRLSGPSLAVLAVVTIAASVGVYAYLAQGGLLGKAELEKYTVQSEGSYWILGGRADFVGSLMLVRESPIVGFGSRPELPEGFDLASRVRGLGYESIAADMRANGLGAEFPLHSQVLTAINQAGLLALPFWATASWLIVKAIRLAASSRAFLSELFVLFSAVWAFAFSPPGAATRVMTASALAIAITIVGRSEKSLPSLEHVSA